MPLWAVLALSNAVTAGLLAVAGNWIVELKAEQEVQRDKMASVAEQIRECNTRTTQRDQREREIARVLAGARARGDVLAEWLRQQPDRAVPTAGADQPADPPTARAGGSAGSLDAEEVEACAATSAQFRAVKDGLRRQGLLTAETP